MTFIFKLTDQQLVISNHLLGVNYWFNVQCRNKLIAEISPKNIISAVVPYSWIGWVFHLIIDRLNMCIQTLMIRNAVIISFRHWKSTYKCIPCLLWFYHLSTILTLNTRSIRFTRFYFTFIISFIFCIHALLFYLRYRTLVSELWCSLIFLTWIWSLTWTYWYIVSCSQLLVLFRQFYACLLSISLSYYPQLMGYL